TLLAIGEPRRYRDKEHLKFVASQPWLFCGRRPSDAHHLRFAQVRALGRKVSDEFTVPLCRLHHREIHQARNEAGWWAKFGIDAVAIAQKLWRTTRLPNDGRPLSGEIQPNAAGPTVVGPATPPGARGPRKPTPPESLVA